MATIQVPLEKTDITLLLQSLDHCLATCETKSKSGKDSPCEDCDKARALRQRLEALITR